jgi:hypothetical protein
MKTVQLNDDIGEKMQLRTAPPTALDITEGGFAWRN